MRLRFLVLISTVLVLSSGLVFGQSISLDHLDGLNGDNRLEIGVPITYYIRLTAGGESYAGITNGFRVYSPDGAAWDTTVGAWTGTLGPDQFDGGMFIKKFSITGSDADTVGFGAFRFSGTGMPGDFDDVALTLDIGPIDEAYDGKTICLDSAFYPPAGVWKWAGPDVYPSWDGPHCYGIGEAGPPPMIECPGETLAATACPGELVCVDLPISYALEVTVEGATWADGQLCFDPFAPDKDLFQFHIVATNAVGADSCDLTVDVTLGVEPVITCPETPLPSFLCNPGLVCVELVIDNATNVTSSLGNWSSNTLCFNADSAGSYAIEVIATSECGDDTCALTVDVTIGDAPMIACPEPIIVEATGNEICVALAITGADSVTVSSDNQDYTATWLADELCFNSDVIGSFTATLIADNSCGADTCAVLITVEEPPPPPNNPPVLADMDTFTVCADSLLEVLVSATDDDEDPLTLSVETLAPNMTFYDSANGHGVLSFTPDMSQVGSFELTAYATDGTDTDSGSFTITVEDCTPPCGDMMLSATEFEFNMTTADVANPDAQTLIITSSGTPFSFEIIPGSASWLVVDPLVGVSGDAISIGVDGLTLEAGIYSVECAVVGDPETVCEPNIQYFTVTLNVLIPPSEDDIVTIATVPAVLGSRVAVPVTIEYLCDLAELSISLEYAGTETMLLDSVSFVGSLIESWSNKNVTITDYVIDLSTAVSAGESMIPATTGLLMTLHFNVDGLAAPGFYPIVAISPDPLFTYDCGAGPQQVVPTVIMGGIVVGSSENYVCGYVVDPDGHSIEGATVELWPDFPYGAWDDQTFSDVTGLFEFFDSDVIPFDLYAYKEGYYPGKVEDINFAQTGIMIVLTPVDPVTPTPEWVNLYCETNLYMGALLPVGSVIDAFDPNGVHCGSWFVSEAGRYGFMPVYRDEEYTPEDEGAEPGDNIRLYVNGVQAYTPDPTEWTGNGDVHQVCLDVGDIIVKNCDLLEGWNLVSWNVDHESDDIVEVLASIEPCLEVVLGFEGEGLTYDPDLPMFSNLEYVDHLSGYWIKVSCDITLEIAGTAVPVTTGIPLIGGWNLVSYLPDYNLPTEDALASIHDDLIVALGWDPAVGGLQYQPGDYLHNNLLEMGPCNGYWLKTDLPGVLTYPGAGPGVAPQINRHFFAAKGTGDGVTATNAWMNLYAHRLTLNGDEVKAGAVVTAHNEDGLMIGRFMLEQDGLFGFMAVYGDDNTTAETDGAKQGESFTLRIDGVQTNESFTYDGATGSMMEVGALTAKDNSGNNLPNSYSLSQNYPNPFNPTTTISFTLPTATNATVEIYNILGRLVAVPFDGVAQSGRNEVNWDGTNSAGQAVASGIYFYRLKTDAFVETKKMTLLK